MHEEILPHECEREGIDFGSSLLKQLNLLKEASSREPGFPRFNLVVRFGNYLVTLRGTMSDMEQGNRGLRVFTKEQTDQLARLRALIDANEDLACQMKQTLTGLQNRIDATSASQARYKSDTEQIGAALNALSQLCPGSIQET